MRLVFAGTPSTALPSLHALMASPRHEVVAVVTRPDRPAGRGRHTAKGPVKAAAEAAGIPVLAPERPRDPDFLAQLADIAPDCCPVVAYGALIPRAALEVPARGWVNLHFSVLPAWRGAAPVQHAVLAGDEVTGASVFQIEEGLDSGPVFGVVTERIRPWDTSGDLLGRLASSGADLLVAIMDGIEDGVVEARPQPVYGVSIAPKLTSETTRVDWTAPGFAVDRLVRAATPVPGAWTTFRDRRVKLAPVLPDVPDDVLAAVGRGTVGKGFGGSAGGAGTAGTGSGRRAARPGGGASGSGVGGSGVGGSGADRLLAPGELAVTGRGQVVVGTGTTPVLLREVRPEGRAPMPADAWARGARLAAGEAFQ